MYVVGYVKGSVVQLVWYLICIPTVSWGCVFIVCFLSLFACTLNPPPPSVPTRSTTPTTHHSYVASLPFTIPGLLAAGFVFSWVVAHRSRSHLNMYTRTLPSSASRTFKVGNDRKSQHKLHFRNFPVPFLVCCALLVVQLFPGCVGAHLACPQYEREKKINMLNAFVFRVLCV